jgi:hypothetical protein
MKRKRGQGKSVPTKGNKLSVVAYICILRIGKASTSAHSNALIDIFTPLSNSGPKLILSEIYLEWDNLPPNPTSLHSTDFGMGKEEKRGRTLGGEWGWNMESINGGWEDPGRMTERWNGR